MRIGIALVQLQGTVKADESLCITVRLAQGNPQVGVSFGLIGIDGKGLTDQIDRPWKIPLLHRHDPQHLQGPSMIRLELQKLSISHSRRRKVSTLV